MLYSQAVDLLNESGLSPEGIATRLSISNSTYRRWLKTPVKKDLPDSYLTNISTGIYKLLSEGLLSHNSARVSKFLRQNLPDFFQAAIKSLHVTPEMLENTEQHQDKITVVLSNLGMNPIIRKEVESSSSVIQKFTGWGNEWKQRIQLLSAVIKNKQNSLMDKLVAYGALFYLILPFDLIPDAIPVFGYVDDFGILGFAMAYYSKNFPGLTKTV